MRLGPFVVGSLLAMSGLHALPVRSENAPPSSTSDWPAFRGPNGSGVSGAKDLPERFDVATNVAWTTSVPPGHSSPIVKGRQLFLTAFDGEKLLLLAFDARTGTEVWRYSMPRARAGEIDAQDNDPASPTPAV